MCGIQPPGALGTLPFVAGAVASLVGSAGVGATVDVGLAMGVGVVVLLSNTPPTPAPNGAMIRT